MTCARKCSLHSFQTVFCVVYYVLCSKETTSNEVSNIQLLVDRQEQGKSLFFSFPKMNLKLFLLCFTTHSSSLCIERVYSKFHNPLIFVAIITIIAYNCKTFGQY